MGVGYIIGGLRSALVVGAFILFIALSPWWDRALVTAYMATFGVITSGILGLLVGEPSALKTNFHPNSFYPYVIFSRPFLHLFI